MTNTNTNTPSVPALEAVNVREFRMRYDALLSKISVDFHSLRTQAELEAWAFETQRAYKRLRFCRCARATSTDREWSEKAINRAALRMCDVLSGGFNLPNVAVA